LLENNAEEEKPTTMRESTDETSDEGSMENVLA